MPIYEYFCTKCGTEFELMRPFSEADKPGVCPKCNSRAQKSVSGFASKTGSYIQPPAEPFGKGIAESVEKQAQPESSEEAKMNEKKVKKPKKQKRKGKDKGKGVRSAIQ